MADLSEDDHAVILRYPLNDSLDRLEKLLPDAEHHYNDGTTESREAYHDPTSKLLTTLMGEKAAFHLRSPAGNKNVASELSRLFACLQDGDFSYDYYRTLDDVLAWWFRLQEDLISESRGTYYSTASKADLTGSKAERQVDLLLRANGASPSQNNHDWRDILVVGELKKSKDEIKTKGTLLQMSRYVRKVFAAQMEAWVFDRSGTYSSGVIDVYEDSRRFFQVLVGYTMMSDEELGLDTFITRDEDGNKSITVKGLGPQRKRCCG
ncbi:hypothetical protein ACJ73_06496 [Blastomyces percursus]|uniref:Fungal-type protein kinase domain-containing protein n=1 Tax=Blastomyces percursus TaxID=1658174 RepID=A0A1J9Q248_9EURO|nr:hypothetical protein ACJ73_06496 [Blastomyces percursus]